MKKKIMALVLVLAVVAVMCGLAACAASGSQGGGSGLVAVFMPTKSLQRWNQDGANMEKELKAKGYAVDLLYAEDTVATQISQVETEINKKPKVMVVASIDSEALIPVLDKASAAGIKIIAYDRLLMKTKSCDYYATFDNYMVGQMQGKFIEDKLGLKTNKGPFNIELFIGSPDDNNAKLFNKGAMDVLQPYIDSKVLVVKSGQVDFATIAIPGWKSETAQKRMDALLTANYGNAKLDAVLSPNDSLAQGIAASLSSKGYGTADKPYPVLTGQDCDINSVKNIIAKKQSMSILKDTRILAKRAATMADQIIKGGTVETNNNTYDNGVKIVPTFLCDIQFADINNWQKLLVDSGYYTADQLK